MPPGLGAAGIWPRYVVPRTERQWAREFLRSTIPDNYEALIAVHVRNMPTMDFKNPDSRLFHKILTYLRTLGRFAFLLIGRDDGHQKIKGPDVFSLAGQKWHFDRTAAVIAQTSLFIGGDSGPTHAAAALGVPLIALGYPSDRMHPFAPPTRYVCFVKGEARRFVERIRPSFGRERGT